MADKQISEHSTEFGSENAVKTMETIGKCLAIIYESTTCQSLNKPLASIHCCMVHIRRKQFCEMPVVLEG
jgi:hypothetical protein